MSIVLTEVESVHGAPSQQRMIFYRCQDHLGQWHEYGPVTTVDPAFDVEGFKAIAAAKIERVLAESEASEIIG